jgi:hypothetical protein
LQDGSYNDRLLCSKWSQLNVEPGIGNKKTYSEVRYNFGPVSFFQILFVLLETTHHKPPRGSKNGKCMKMDITRSSPGPFTPSHVEISTGFEWHFYYWQCEDDSLLGCCGV